MFILSQNWSKIKWFTHQATYTGNPIPIALNYNANGKVSIQLPQGPASDAYQIYLFVNVIDDTEGTTVYNLPTPVAVLPNNLLAASLADSISSNDPTSQILMDLNSGNLNVVAKNVIALTSVFNIQSQSTTTTAPNATASFNNQMAELREFMISKVTDLSISDMSSIKVISSALSAATGVPQQISTKTAVILQKFTAFTICFTKIYFIY